MSVAVICTGTELLKGSCCNTDLRFAGEKLTAASLPPVLEICVPDHAGKIVSALAFALQNADIIIISGGLGPTSDDITLETAARFFGAELEEIPELKEKVAAHWALRHSGHCPKFQYKQAKIIKGGKYFDNPVGTASGIGFESNYRGEKKHIYLLPGPPAEFEAVFSGGVLPDILELQAEKLYTTGFLVCATGESSVARTVEPLLKEFAGVEIAYTATPAGTKLFLSSKDPATLAQAVDAARNAIGINALIPGATSLPEALLKKLASAGLTMGCAESCTGGMIADMIVSIPGSSAVFQGGIVSYANQVKNNILHVPEEVLAGHGAVSSECASAMVHGACKALNTHCAVSTTGVAGPDGGTPEKPVGLVYIAAAVNNLTAVKKLQLHGNRQTIRERAANAALFLLWQLLDAPEGDQC